MAQLSFLFADVICLCHSKHSRYPVQLFRFVVGFMSVSYDEYFSSMESTSIFFGTIIIGIGFIVVLTPRSFVALSLSWAVRSLIAFTAFVWYLLMSIRSRTMQSCLWPWFGNVTANSSLLYCHFARLFSPAGDGVLTCPRSVFCFKRLIKSIFFPLIGKFSLSSFVVIP